VEIMELRSATKHQIYGLNVHRALRRICILTVALVCCVAARAEAIEVLTQFDPSAAGSLCAIGVDQTTGDVWLYECSGSELLRYSSAGAFQTSFSSPGEVANDVDLDFSLGGMNLNGSFLPAGTLLFVNGETDTADVYAVNTTTGAVIDTLETEFGVSHVVGGAYHPGRDTFFLVQDRVPGAADENRIAEVDPVTGVVVNTFQIGALFDVNYGDIDICPSSGNLFVVSSREDSIGEFTPEGSLVAYHDLPSGVSGLTGIAIGGGNDAVWVSSFGSVTSLGDFPCPMFADGFETGDTSRWTTSVP
jgi:hypothetical protein